MKSKKFLIVFVAVSLFILSACSIPFLSSVITNSSGTQPTPILVESTSAAPQEPTVVPSETPEEAVPTEPAVQPASGWVAYIAYDGNVWLVDRASGDQKQLTGDAILVQPNVDTEPVTYCCMQWSSDGALLSFRREQSIKIASGYNYDYTYLVYVVAADQVRVILADQTFLGYAWQPGTHTIAYGQPIDEKYWTSRPAEPSEYARGIWALNVDTGETYEWVKPERGFTLGLPQWSPDGRYLGFEEISLMEGRGEFAYYDFEQQQYVAWEDIIGSYCWSPDGSHLVYDRFSYLPSGTEQIFLNTRQGDAEQPLSPSYTPGYAAFPAYSPNGEKIAYLAELIDTENNIFNLFVISASGGEPQDLGTFQQVWALNWTSDSDYIILNAIPFDQKLVFEVNVLDGSVRQLTPGSEAVPQPGS